MRRWSIAIMIVIMASFCHAQQEFKQTQKTYSRVRSAYAEIGNSITTMLAGMQMEPGNMELYIRAFKMEKEIEIWVRQRESSEFRLLKNYPICATSGSLGPKRREGDLQIPEGFYTIDVFNPWSNFHLSMCINYPNVSDRKLGVQGNLGGNICIHGACVTIGCIPLTDRIIKEVYLLCIEARNNGQTRIPVTIYPARLTDLKFKMLTTLHGDYPDKINLWSDMKIAYDLYTVNKRLPRVTFLADGRHQIE